MKNSQWPLVGQPEFSGFQYRQHKYYLIKKIYGVEYVGEGNIGLRVVGERGKQYQNIVYKILKDTFKIKIK